MNKNHALGLPRNSVRAIVTLALTFGFILLIGILAYGIIFCGVSLDMGLGLIGAYTPILTVALMFYFRTREDMTSGDSVPKPPPE